MLLTISSDRIKIKFDSEQFYIKHLRKGGAVPMRHERSIGYEVKTLDNLLYRNMLAQTARRGIDELTMMHGWVIGYLYNNQDKDIFQKDLETEFCIGRSTVTNILKLMEKKGYVRRESVACDARLKKLVLTERGIRLYEEKEDIIEEMERQMTEAIGREELEMFLNTVKKLKKKLKEQLDAECARGRTEKTDRKENESL